MELSLTDELVSSHWCVWRTSEAQAAPRQPLDEQTRRNQDAIMIRVMSDRWRSASDELVSGQLVRVAHERSAGRLSAAPR
jgi:hypothetical protein